MSSKPLHWIVIFTFLACSQICLSFETVPLAPIDEIWTPPSKHEVGYYKALKILNKLKQNLLLKKKDKVIASTCRTSLILSEFLDQKELHSPTHTPNTSKIALDKPPKNLHAILQVIRETVLGRAILKKFYPRYGFDIKIKYQPKEQIRKLTKNMALASYDPMKKVIHIDKSGETGKIAYVLLHEIVHALDVDFTNALEKQIRLRKKFYRDLKRLVVNTSRRLKIPKDELVEIDYPSHELNRLAWFSSLMDQMQTVHIYRAERFAYDASYDVWKALRKRFPKYYKEKTIYHNDKQIIMLNKLNPLYVKKYKSGLCTLFTDKMLRR